MPINTDAAVEIADKIETESYYRFNLLCVLAEASDAERATVRNLLDRARHERSEIAARRRAEAS